VSVLSKQGDLDLFALNHNGYTCRPNFNCLYVFILGVESKHQHVTDECIDRHTDRLAQRNTAKGVLQKDIPTFVISSLL